MEFFKPTPPKIYLEIFLTGFVFFFFPAFSWLTSEPVQCYDSGKFHGVCSVIYNLFTYPTKFGSFLIGLIVCYLVSCAIVFFIDKRK